MDESVKVAVDGIIAQLNLLAPCKYEYIGPPSGRDDEWLSTHGEANDVLYNGVIVQCKHIRVFLEATTKSIATISGAALEYFQRYDHVEDKPKYDQAEAEAIAKEEERG